MLKSGGWKRLSTGRGAAKQRATDGAIFLKAAKMQKLRLVRMMLDGGVDVNWQNDEGYNALMCVITSHTSEADDPQASSKYTMCDYLLKVGIEANARDRNGKTALIHACQMNVSTDIIQLLIVCNADPAIRDFSASSALEYARAQQNDVVIKLLTHAADMNKPTSFSDSPGAALISNETLQFQSYLHAPQLEKIASVDTATEQKTVKPSARQLRRQNTVCCTRNDDFRRLWMEEIANSRKQASAEHKPAAEKSCTSVTAAPAAVAAGTCMRRRNTTLAITSDYERADILNLDSPYYDKKRTEQSLFDFERKALDKNRKALARDDWLTSTKEQFFLGERSQLQTITDGDTSDTSADAHAASDTDRYGRAFRSLSLNTDRQVLIPEESVSPSATTVSASFAPVLARSLSEQPASTQACAADGGETTRVPGHKPRHHSASTTGHVTHPQRSSPLPAQTLATAAHVRDDVTRLVMEKTATKQTEATNSSRETGCITYVSRACPPTVTSPATNDASGEIANRACADTSTASACATVATATSGQSTASVIVHAGTAHVTSTTTIATTTAKTPAAGAASAAAAARTAKPFDARPKHPHAKFLQARSKTFHFSGSPFKGEELVETI